MTIFETKDEWYYISVNTSYYKCDQKYGLMKFLEDKIPLI